MAIFRIFGANNFLLPESTVRQRGEVFSCQQLWPMVGV
jgi:hypothetical protein